MQEVEFKRKQAKEEVSAYSNLLVNFFIHRFHKDRFLKSNEFLCDL